MKNLPDDFRFSKSRGQNFLVDLSVPRRIAETAQLDGRDVLEVGPGLGALTLELAPCAARVLCLEVDRLLLEPLNTALADAGASNVTVLNVDALKCDLGALLDERFGSSSRPVVCANLPYSITAPILTKLIELRRFEAITVMIQLEVAQRICATPATKDYGAFSVFAQYHTVPRILFTVPPTAFHPRPKVTSAVVRMETRAEPLTSDERQLFRVVRASFAQRRKTLQNALSAGLNLPKERVGAILAELRYAPDVRGETLSVAEFIRIAELL